MVRLRLSINTSAFSFLRRNPQTGLLRDQKSPRVAGLKVPASSWWSLETAQAPKHQIETRTCQQDTKIQQGSEHTPTPYKMNVFQPEEASGGGGGLKWL